MKAQLKGFVLQKLAKSILQGECPGPMKLPILTLLVWGNVIEVLTFMNVSGVRKPLTFRYQNQACNSVMSAWNGFC